MGDIPKLTGVVKEEDVVRKYGVMAHRSREVHPQVNEAKYDTLHGGQNDTQGL